MMREVWFLVKRPHGVNVPVVSFEQYVYVAVQSAVRVLWLVYMEWTLSKYIIL